MVADTLSELHEFAYSINLKRSYFHGVMKGHPHYDLTNDRILQRAINNGAKIITKKEILLKSKLLATSYYIDDFKTILNWLHNNYGFYSYENDHFNIGHGMMKQLTCQNLLLNLKKITYYDLCINQLC